MLQRRPQLTALNGLLSDLERGAYVLDCGEHDLPRIRVLVNRYADLSLGFSDAAVVACAERHGGRALTADRRDLDVVARGERGLFVVP